MSHTAAAPEAPSPHLPLGRLILTPPHLEAQAVVDRIGHWNSALKPWDNYECWLTQGVSRETIHLERLHQQEILLRHAQAQRARGYWDEDRRADAESLAVGLMKHPGLVIPQLRRTKHGCEFLAEQWDALRATAEARGDWSAPARLLALNLLGVLPELRDAVTPLDAPAGTDPAAHLVAVAAAQARRHRDLASALTPVDAIEREAACVGLAPDTPAAASPAQRGACRRPSPGLVPLAVQDLPPRPAPARPRRPARLHPARPPSRARGR